MNNILEIENLTILDNNGNCVVDNISLHVKKNEIFGVSGSQNCGRNYIINAIVFAKRLGLKIISGKVYFTKGKDCYEIFDNGKKNRKAFNIFRKNSAYISNPRYLFRPTSSIGSQISQAIRQNLKMSFKQAKIAAIHNMQKCGINDAVEIYSCKSNVLKDGVLYKAMIAQAVGKGATFILADNPLLGSDLTIKAQIVNLINNLKNTVNFSMFLSEKLSISLELADRIIVMEGGIISKYFVKEDFEQIYFDQSNMIDFLNKKVVGNEQ